VGGCEEQVRVTITPLRLVQSGAHIAFVSRVVGAAWWHAAGWDEESAPSRTIHYLPLTFTTCY
jgi:hypothetical protein